MSLTPQEHQQGAPTDDPPPYREQLEHDERPRKGKTVVVVEPPVLLPLTAERAQLAIAALTELFVEYLNRGELDHDE